MKAWLLKDFGLDNLQQGETATPTPKAGELLVKVGAVSLNFRDKAIVDGIYEPHMVPKPLIPVSDAAGTVVAVGEGVSRFAVGDRVNSHLYSRWLDGMPASDEPDYCFGSPLPGGLAEFMIIHEDSAVRAPDDMTDEEASTLPIAALTAWYSLVDYGQIEPGQTCWCKAPAACRSSPHRSPWHWAPRSSSLPAATTIWTRLSSSAQWRA